MKTFCRFLTILLIPLFLIHFSISPLTKGVRGLFEGNVAFASEKITPYTPETEESEPKIVKPEPVVVPKPAKEPEFEPMELPKVVVQQPASKGISIWWYILGAVLIAAAAGGGSSSSGSSGGGGGGGGGGGTIPVTW